jgi:peptide/nickel transport system substrate-binding protein
MNRLPARLTTVAALAAVTALAVTGCSAGSSSSQSSSGTSSKTLVVDNTFDLVTADPARAFELTGTIVDKATSRSPWRSSRPSRCPRTTRRSR